MLPVLLVVCWNQERHPSRSPYFQKMSVMMPVISVDELLKAFYWILIGRFVAKSQDFMIFVGTTCSLLDST